MGKSTSAEILRQRGIPVVDSDLIAREVVEPGQPALLEIRARFGDGVFDSNGRIRREALAERVFSDATARQELEAILHPRIRAIWESRLEAWRAEGRAVAVVVIPLLFETGAASSFEATVCVACSAASQRQRLRGRGWTDEQIDQRIRAQWPVERKMLLADAVVWTEAGLAVHEEQWRRIIP